MLKLLGGVASFAWWTMMKLDIVTDQRLAVKLSTNTDCDHVQLAHANDFDFYRKKVVDSGFAGEKIQ